MAPNSSQYAHSVSLLSPEFLGSLRMKCGLRSPNVCCFCFLIFLGICPRIRSHIRWQNPKHFKWLLQMEICTLLPKAVFPNTSVFAIFEELKNSELSQSASLIFNRDLVEKQPSESWAGGSSWQQIPPSTRGNFRLSLRKWIFTGCLSGKILTLETLKWASTRRMQRPGLRKTGNQLNKLSHDNANGILYQVKEYHLKLFHVLSK